MLCLLIKFEMTFFLLTFQKPDNIVTITNIKMLTCHQGCWHQSIFELVQLWNAEFVGGPVCNNISVDKSKIFVNNQKKFLIVCKL